MSRAAPSDIYLAMPALSRSGHPPATLSDYRSPERVERPMKMPTVPCKNVVTGPW
jgi:hypothetical protein